MSRNLSKVNVEALADESASDREPEVNEALAEVALQAMPAELRGRFKLGAWTSKKIVGNYLARGIAGNILADAVMEEDNMRRNMKALSDLIQTKDGGVATAETKVAACDAYSRLYKAKVDRDVANLKAAEIASLGNKKKKKHGLAPQVTKNVQINGDVHNTQIVKAPELKEVT